MEKECITEEDEFLKGQGYSIDGFVARTVKSGGNHVMSVSWLKRGLFIRDMGVCSRRRGILPGGMEISLSERKCDGFGR
jgi:hypothetical protein